MYSLATFSLSDMTECASELRKLGAGASSAQEVAQRIVSYLYRQLGNDETGRQDCVLSAVFSLAPRILRVTVGAGVPARSLLQRNLREC